MEAVQVEYELGVPLDQIPAAMPFATGKDMLNLLGILGRLEQFRDDKPRQVDWRLLGTNGNRVALRSASEPDVATRAALSLVRGFAEAEEQPKVPSHWSVQAASLAKSVAARLGDTVDTGMRLSISGPEPIESQVTRRAQRHLQLATALRFTGYGSVTGVLGRVTAYKGRRAALWSDLDGRRVEVRFGEHHIEDMRNAWARQHVEVTGVVHENSEGQVLRVDMDSLRVLDGQTLIISEALPSGFYPELTGGKSTAEFLRAIRGDE